MEHLLILMWIKVDYIFKKNSLEFSNFTILNQKYVLIF